MSAKPFYTPDQVAAALLTNYGWSGSVITYRYPVSTNLPVTFESGASSPLNSSQIAAAELALQLWDDLIAPRFQRVGDGEWADISFLNSRVGVSYAYAYYPTSRSSSVAGSIWFNPNWNSGNNSLTSPTVGKHGFMSFVHEIGHALGLDHAASNDVLGLGYAWARYVQDSTTYTVMSYNAIWEAGEVSWNLAGEYFSAQTPMVYDIYAIQLKYGADLTTRREGTTYGFNASASTFGGVFDFTANRNPILSIYDAAGVDWLDVSGFGAKSVIRLDPGSYSDVNGMTKNIGIAFNTVIENVRTGAGNDVVFGNAAANRVETGGGADSVAGAGGADAIFGGDGRDTLDGGAGADVLHGEGGEDLLYGYLGGASANDGGNRLFGGAGDDTLYGAAGGDVLEGGLGADLMVGGGGNDTYYVDNALDRVSEGVGGGVDEVIINIERYTLPGEVERGRLGARGREVIGNALDNVLIANAQGAILRGGLGHDTLYGGDAGAALYGTGLKNTHYGGLGNDSYYVFGGRDVVVEALNQGRDTVYAFGDVSLSAHVEDLIVVGLAPGTAFSQSSGNALANRISGNASANRIWAGAGDDVLYGGAGNDSLYGGLGADQMYGGLGNDEFTVDHVGDRVFESAGQGQDRVISSIDYALTAHVENLSLAGSAGLQATGNALNNVIHGNAGANHIRGGGGNDRLFGGAGNDTLDGGQGADTLQGGLGNDLYIVDSLLDLVQDEVNGGVDHVRAFVDYRLGAHIENLTLMGGAALTGTGNAFDNVINGNTGANILRGEAGNDRLFGGAGNDTLEGGLGVDRLNGGLGVDHLFGGVGADIFILSDIAHSPAVGGAWDRIYDFSRGLDRVDLSAIDADTAQQGDQAFRFVGTQGFSRSAGELRYGVSGTGLLVMGDTNGDGVADFALHINDTTPLRAADFIL